MTLGSATEVAPLPRRRVRNALVAATGILPFGIYVTIFLVVPTVAVAIGAFRTPTGQWTWSNISAATHGTYAMGSR